MENSTATTNNKITTSSSMKEKNDEVPTLELLPTHPCIGRGDRKRTSGSNVSLNAHPGEVSSNGVVGQGADHSNPFQMAMHEEEKKLKAKIARSNRQKAIQKSRNLKMASSVDDLIISPPSNSSRSRRTNKAQSSTNCYEEHPKSIYTHDNVKLRFVLQKLLTSSDVSDQGRIVLPKREAEENLPRLYSKEGTLFIMREVLSDTEWQVTYRFWANHKGRIYILYNCGEFVSKNMLEVGDKLTLYQDVFKNNFFTITKKEKHVLPASNEDDKEEEISEEEEEKEGEANELMSSHTDGSNSTNQRGNIPVFFQFF